MAEKHKSKYKAPKDLEKSQKPKPRKDLKDYTHDDKTGALNPKSTGQSQTNVLRKRDKEMVDTGDIYIKYNADDRLYADLEDGEYDPKHAAKILKKRQDKDEKDNEKNIKDKIENLTREGKERLVREYIRRKIVKILMEAEEPATPEEETTAPPAETTPDASAAPSTTTEPAPTEPSAEMPTDVSTATPAPGAPAPATPETTSTTPEMSPETTPETPTTPAPEQPAAQQPATQQPTPEELENRALTNAAKELEKEGGVGKIKAISKILGMSMKETDPADQANFYRLLRGYAIKKLGKLQSQPTKK